jgi:hypothetical protein
MISEQMRAVFKNCTLSADESFLWIVLPKLIWYGATGE